MLQRSGQLDAAVEVMTRLLDAEPGDADLHYDFGVLFGEAEDWSRAVEIMHQVLELEPDHASALNFIGYSWADRGERLDEAEGLIRRALELRPGDGYITDSLGWLFYQRGLQRLEDGRDRDAREAFSSAVRELERAVELTKPGDPVITRHLADAYRSVSRFSDAIATYRRSLELDPSEADLVEIHLQIELLVLQSAPPGAAR